MVDAPPVQCDGPALGPRFLLAHGAGAPMDSPWMAHLAAGLAGAGVRVVRFEFPYMTARRRDGTRRPPDREAVLRDTWHRVIDEHGPGPATVIGGKSMGGRIASLLADEAGVRGLVCLGYPFHPSGQPDRLRTAHLLDLQTPALICQGTRDPLGNEATVSRLPLSQAIRILWVEDGDHGFRPRKAAPQTESGNLSTVIGEVARFVRTMAD